ncbi:MAG: hypothetical protein CVU91_08480 [Firmicutes bacterium HGW-Firmicutes-16]|nr:MAG: hypothetical protein CVU91_08480 [Firmicutes bacterium HGW-Firmicutes-16]
MSFSIWLFSRSVLNHGYVDLSKTDEKALNIALNKISGEWDEAELLNAAGNLLIFRVALLKGLARIAGCRL